MTISIRTGVAVPFAAAIAAAVPAFGEIGNPVVATGGEVTVTILGGTAGYTNDLYLVTGSTQLRIGSNRDFGLTMNLGYFAAGTELVFAMRVLDTGNQFFTGSAGLNPDGIPHANVTVFDGYSTIGFEDIFYGGDFDYDDCVFNCTNVVPAPGVAALGLIGAAFPRRRRR